MLGGGVDFARVFIHCLLSDGVAFFWFIMGFFLFENQNYIRMVKRILKKILLPAIVVVIITQFLADWFEGKRLLLDCILNPHLYLNDVFLGIRAQTADYFRMAPHLWYVFSYLQVIIWFPVLKKISGNGKENRSIRYFLMGLSLLALFVRIIQNYILFTLVIYHIFTPVVLEVLIGYEIYLNIDQIRDGNKSSWLIAIFFLIFIIGNILRSILQIILYEINSSNQYLMSWDNIFSLICASAFTIFILMLKINVKKWYYCIRYFSGKTYYIYLIHWAVIERLKTNGFFSYIGNINKLSDGNVSGTIFYTIESIIVVFGICLSIIAIGEFIFDMFLRLKNVIIINE